MKNKSLWSWLCSHHHNCPASEQGGTVKASSSFEAFCKAYKEMVGIGPYKADRELAKKDHRHERKGITYGVNSLCNCKCQPIHIKKLPEKILEWEVEVKIRVPFKWAKLKRDALSLINKKIGYLLTGYESTMVVQAVEKERKDAKYA